MPDLGNLTQTFGLPVALTVYFIWQNAQLQKDHKADLKDLAIKVTEAMGKSTDAIEESNKTMLQISEIMRHINSGSH